MCKITQKNHSPPRVTTLVEHEAFFVQNQMGKGQSLNRVRVRIRTQTTTKESLTIKPRIQPSMLDEGVRAWFYKNSLTVHGLAFVIASIRW